MHPNPGGSFEFPCIVALPVSTLVYICRNKIMIHMMSSILCTLSLSLPIHVRMRSGAKISTSNGYYHPERKRTR